MRGHWEKGWDGSGASRAGSAVTDGEWKMRSAPDSEARKKQRNTTEPSFSVVPRTRHLKIDTQYHWHCCRFHNCWPSTKCLAVAKSGCNENQPGSWAWPRSTFTRTTAIPRPSGLDHEAKLPMALSPCSTCSATYRKLALQHQGLSKTLHFGDTGVEVLVEVCPEHWKISEKCPWFQCEGKHNCERGMWMRRDKKTF